MDVETFDISGVLLITPNVFEDKRGYFYESWQHERYEEVGIQEHFVQDNISVSKKNVLRGLHFQSTASIGQLVTVLEGKVFDVVVDLRRSSPTFKQFLTFELSSNLVRQLYMPPGFAHGFYVLSESAMLHYKCTEYYEPTNEAGLLWNDLPIPWPIDGKPIMADRDSNFPRFDDIPIAVFPKN